jgi:hypothetical protein
MRSALIRMCSATDRYATLTITADGKSLATVQTKTTRNFTFFQDQEASLPR